MTAPRFDIADDVWPLIEAAIRFGDRLVELSFVTDEQRRGIVETQKALRRLPDVTPGPRREYGIELMSSERAAHEASVSEGAAPAPSYHLSWDVEYSVRDGDHYLGIGGLHHPPERGTSLENEFAGDEHETWYETFTSERSACLDKPYHPEAPHRPWWQTWAWGTENPAFYVAPGVHVEVSVTLGRYTWVTDSEGGKRAHDWSEYDWWKGDS